jgi:hypothetical protein
LVQRAIRSPALDERTRLELEREWSRHRGEIGRMRAGERERLVREFDEHMDRVHAIMLRLLHRRVVGQP